MPETLREIVDNGDNLYTFSINKNDDFDRYMWEFKVTDKRSEMYGVTDKLIKYDYKIVTLRRGDHFFPQIELKVAIQSQDSETQAFPRCRISAKWKYLKMHLLEQARHMHFQIFPLGSE